MQKWKVIYLDYSGNVVVTIVDTDLYNVANAISGQSIDLSKVLVIKRYIDENAL